MLAAGPAMSSTRPAPGVKPFAMSDTAIGIEPVAHTYIGMAMASTIATSNLMQNYVQIKAFRDYFKQEIKANCSDFVFNESEQNSPYILSVSFKGIRGEVLLHILDKCGVVVGIGSACSSKKQSNRVLEQMGVKKDYVLGNIRLSFSSFNKPEEIAKATKIFVEQYKLLKDRMSK